jgi:CheY-like chemotaxis protein
MMDITASAAPGMITLEPGDDPETAWSRLRDLGRASGLAPLRAARLALAVTTVVGQRCGPTVVEIARVDDAQGAHVEATIDGGNATPSPASSGLVDASRRHLSAARTVTWILPVNVTEDAATDDPAWAELNDAAARSPDTRRLLLAVLAAVARQHADRTAGVDSEVLALRIELDESNQGLLALHAELSEQHDELEHARAAAEQATRDKADSLAKMGHEICSSMNVFVGFTGLLQATALSTEQVEYTAAIESAGEHLLGVIDGILTTDVKPHRTDAAPTPADPPRPRRVLFVDDNPLLTELVERIFAGDPGVTVQTAPDGRTALRLACQQQPDIVLLDLHLSDMSGEALLRQLSADTRTRWIPAVIVSGATTPAAIERLSDLGVVAYLTKPFTSSQLRKLVNTVGRPDREGTAPTP